MVLRVIYMRNHLALSFKKSTPKNILIRSGKWARKSEFNKQPKLIRMPTTFKVHFEKHGSILKGGKGVGDQVERKQITRGSMKSQPQYREFFTAPCLLVERTLIPLKIRVPLHQQCLKWIFFSVPNTLPEEEVSHFLLENWEYLHVTRISQSRCAFWTLILLTEMSLSPLFQRNGHHYTQKWDEQYLERTTNKLKWVQIKNISIKKKKQ